MYSKTGLQITICLQVTEYQAVEEQQWKKVFECDSWLTALENRTRASVDFYSDPARILICVAEILIFILSGLCELNASTWREYLVNKTSVSRFSALCQCHAVFLEVVDISTLVAFGIAK